MLKYKEDIMDSNRGNFSFHHLDSKGKQVLNFVKSNYFTITNTYFKAKIYRICKSFNSAGSIY